MQISCKKSQTTHIQNRRTPYGFSYSIGSITTYLCGNKDTLLLYARACSIVCIAIAHDEQLAISDRLASYWQFTLNVLHCGSSTIVVKFHRVFIRVDCIHLKFHFAVNLLDSHCTFHQASEVQWI